MKDTFSYSARWDSIGLDCSHCKNFLGPSEWPDKDKVSQCLLHNLSLKIELGENGYKRGEWFCKDFDDLNAFPMAVKEFELIRKELQDCVLYVGNRNGELFEIKFDRLKN
ncbi:MAG TPA: hypothetical protein VD908_01220 [Cytophagales bacterium]|nr:hypothetical protein [Cytophagales bacterium]